NVRRLRAIVEAPAWKDITMQGERLQRAPRGFPKDHEALEYLKYRNFIAGCEFPPAFATSPSFYATLLRVFRRVAPFSRFLNEPLAPARPAARTRHERP